MSPNTSSTSDPLFFPGGRPAVGGFSVTRTQSSRFWSVWALVGRQKVTSLLCKDFTFLYTFSESLVAPFSNRSLNRGAAVISECAIMEDDCQLSAVS